MQLNAIHIFNVFHRVNLTLGTVTSIHNIQKIDQNLLETRKQHGSCSVTPTRTIQVLKEKEIELIIKASVEQEQKGVKEKNVIDTPCESNINAVVEEHFSSENI